MGANTEALRGTRQVQLPAWIVIATAAALTAALAVLTISEDATTPARAPGVAIAATAGSPDDVTEIAELKTARAMGTAFRSAEEPTTKPGQDLASRGPSRRFPTTSDEMAWLKATRAQAANPFGRHS